ncbi:hypothetical protein GI374_17830 [Paracoccus sp. S-4012]|uniref:hypothetical protein n=1 Tax=Paracoccus sp. S-4012 TaxID=2665648 RepID=UPI0012B002DB|nr:hypothetical protein [Paracoccus sp. S-4012]MRX52217.1 hypothetical protein [Paracoccus sp. S-4012]
MRRIIVSAAALILAAGLASAEAAEPYPVPAEGQQFWGLGKTGILCCMAPCPWRGVFPIEADGSAGRPLSAADQPDPPPMQTSDEDRARIEAAYEDGCRIVEGRFEGETLVVTRVVAECRHWFRP